MKRLILPLTVAVFLFACQSENQKEIVFPELQGNYLGQVLPDTVPTLFAPGIVSTGMFTRDIAMPPSGDEICFSVVVGNYSYSFILYSKLINGKWTKPEPLPFAASGKTAELEPAFSPDGNRLYFLSSRPDAEEETGDQDLWFVDKAGDGWENPVNLGSPVNTDGGEFFPSLTKDGYLYYTHNDKGNPENEIWRCRVYADSFGNPEKLPANVNCGANRFNAYISPGHDYLILPVIGMPDAFDQVDYYIVFRNENDQWSKPLNLGEQINKDNSRGWSPYVSPDGKYFFFMSNKCEDIPANELSYDRIRELYNSPGNGKSDIYWMQAGFIEKLKEKAVFEN